jgi:hypothetical protein
VFCFEGCSNVLTFSNTFELLRNAFIMQNKRRPNRKTPLHVVPGKETTLKSVNQNEVYGFFLHKLHRYRECAIIFFIYLFVYL